MKIIKILSIVAAIIAVFFCLDRYTCYKHENVMVISENSQYSVVYDDGQYSLRFVGGFQQYKPTGNGNRVAEYPTYTSLNAMKRGILSGKFTKNQLATLSVTGTLNSSGDLVITNLDLLFEAKLPEDMGYYAIHWMGDQYSFSIDSNGIMGKRPNGGFYYLPDEEAYNQRIAAENAMLFENDELEFLLEETDAERDGTVYTWQYNGYTTKRIIYTCESEGKELLVHEQYYTEQSSEVPHDIQIWGKENGAWFYVYLRDFDERPSYEWVTSFGLKPYVETETE